MALAEEISRQPNIDCHVVFVITLTEIYNEKEQVEQGKIRNAQFEEKSSTKKYNGSLSLMLKELKV